MNLNNLILDANSKLNQSKIKFEEIQTNTKNIIHKKSELEKNIHSNIFLYDSTYILDMMEISVSAKKTIADIIQNVYIYTIKGITDETFFIKYSINNDEYEFKIIINNKRFDPIVHVYKNNIQVNSYNMKVEFIALDFEKIKNDKFLENYISLIIKNNKDYKFGMIILAHYYLIEYKRYKMNDINICTIIKNIKKLTEIFRYDLSSYVFDNFDNQLKI